MQAVKSVEVNCWESDGQRDRKGNLVESFPGCWESRYYLGEFVWGNRWEKESFGKWIDGVENGCSQEIQCSLVRP